MNKYKLFSIITVLSLALTNTAHASHAWGTYHWARTANPFTLKVDNNMNAGWSTFLGTAASDWSLSPVMDLVLNNSGVTNKNCKAKLGYVQACNGKYGNNGWLGIAQIWVNGSHITQATTKMNDTYFSTAKYNNPNEKLHVVCQEIGHTFGLDHQSEDGSSLNTCMDYFSNTGVNATSTLSTHPNAHDYEELETIYAHLDSTTTIDKNTVNANAAVDLNDPSAWGKLIRESSDKKAAVFEKNLDKNNKLFTFVTWVK